MKRILTAAALALTAGAAPLLAQPDPMPATSGFHTTLPLDVEAVNERAAALLERMHQEDGPGDAE